MTCRYCSICLRFSQVSLSESQNTVVRNAIAVYIPVIVGLITKISFLMIRWNIISLSSIRRFPLLLILTRCSDERLTLDVVTYSENSSTALSMYPLIYILNFTLSVKYIYIPIYVCFPPRFTIMGLKIDPRYKSFFHLIRVLVGYFNVVQIPPELHLDAINPLVINTCILWVGEETKILDLVIQLDI